jgi:HK97 family phage portal protein
MSWPVYSKQSDDAAQFIANPATAMRLTPVRRAVTAVSADLARIPIRVHTWTGNEYSEIHRSEAHALNRDWNSYHTAYEARRWLVSQAMLWGNSFAVISRTGTAVDSLIPLNAWNVTLNTAPDGTPVYSTSEYGEVACSDILHFRMLPTTRQMWGTSPVADAVRALQLGAMLETAGVEGFRAPGLGKLALSTQEVLGAEQVRAAQDAFKSAHSGPDGMLRPIIAQGGASIEQVGRSLVDQDWAAARRQVIEEVARAFGVPPFVLFSDSTTYTQEQARMYGESLAGYTAGFAEEIRRKLFPDEDVRVTFDMTTIQRGSFNEAMDGYTSAIQLGILTPNEVRKELGLPPLDGGDDMRVGPNMQSVPGGTKDADDLPPDGGAGISGQD